MQTAVGFACIALGCLHFIDRGRTPHARSFYFGSVTSSHTFRAVLAVIELLCGFVPLFTA